MNRTKDIMRRACYIVCLTFGLAGIALAQTSTCKTVANGDVCNPHLATGNTIHNGLWGATRLNAGDSVIIEAPQVTPASAPYNTTGICQSIVNNSLLSIFVPWNTPGEWQAFLNATGQGTLQKISVVPLCCTPQTATICNSATALPLGQRTLGTVLQAGSTQANMVPVDTSIAPGPLVPNPTAWGGNHWGAVGDEYTLTAATVLNNNTINEQVTYNCVVQNGAATWVKNIETGSCTPLAGACSNLSGSNMTSLPTDTTTLCAAGSILQNLTSTSTGWTWQCNGTPNYTGGCPAGDTTGADGSCDASCSASNQPPINGACNLQPAGVGAILPNNDSFNGVPNLTYYSYAQVMALATVPNAPQLCSSGTILFNGDVPYLWSQGDYIQYACQGINGGTCQRV